MKKIFTLLISFFFLIPLCAQNQTDDTTKNIVEEDLDEDVMSLFEIDKLIRKTDYNRALLELHKYIERYPERFDNAQRLIKNIMNRRNRYSVLTEKAIKVSTENPEDHITPSEIILEMRSLEKNPPEDIKKVIDLLEDMHLFKYYAYLFEKIQNESAALSHNSDTLGALNKVQEGFWIYKDEFLAEWASNQSIIREAENIEADLLSILNDFKSVEFRERLNNLTNQFIKSVNDGNYAQANEQLPALTRAFKTYADKRNSFNPIIIRYRNLYNKQKKINPQLTDACYVAFMERFVSGLSSLADSGIIGAADYEYSSNLEKIKNAVLGMFDSRTKEYLNALPKDIINGTIDEAFLTKNDTVAKITGFTEIVKKINSCYSYLQSTDKKAYNLYPEFDSTVDYLSSLVKQNEKVCNIAKKVSEEQIHQNEILLVFRNNKKAQDFNSSDLTKQLFSSVGKMNSITGEKENLVLEYFTWSSGKTERWKLLTERYNDYVEQIFNSTSKSVIAVWKEIAESYVAGADRYTKQLEEYVNYSEIYQKGFTNQIDEETCKRLKKDATYLLEYAKSHKSSSSQNALYHYPDLTLEMTDFVVRKAEEYQKSLQKSQNELKQNASLNKEWSTNPEISKIINNSQNSITEKQKIINNVSLSSGKAKQKAQQDIDEAKRLERNGDSIFQEAESEYRRSNLQNAEKLVDDATEKYMESLNLADNHELRRSSEAKRKDLLAKILFAKNEIVVRESRELYQKAKNAQNADRFDDAQTYITAAITKWAETHDEPNAEFQDYLEIVNTAVSMKTGRILLASDPLYAEMSQLMSSAYQSFDAGSKYYKEGNKEEGNKAFENAIDCIDKIKQVYPVNKEASLLRLKIDKIQNPVKFEQDFADKVRTAVNKCRRSETKIEGYNDLVTYYDLNPNYRGLKSTIENIEIELGMRQKPVDNSAAARSNRLTSEAQSIFSSAGNNQSRLNTALARVNEAIRLNPNNTQAQRLKDRISTQLGASKNIILSAEDEQLYNLAKNAYLQKKYDEAKAYMDEQWKKSSNRNIEKVKSLKKSIDSKV